MDDTQRKERYREIFEAWLDRAMAEDAPLEGIDPEILSMLDEAEPSSVKAPDLYTLFEALGGLTSEIRLQGRAFKALSDAVAPLLARVDEVAERGETALAEARRIAALALDTSRDLAHERAEQAEERATAESLDLILDLRERLARGIEAAEGLLGEGTGRKGPIARLLRFGGRDDSALRALLAGQRLTLERIDDALRRSGVSVIDCLGRPFEPGLMSAVDVHLTTEEEDGTVVEVYRSGYERAGTVLRVAQVKVARRPFGETWDE